MIMIQIITAKNHVLFCDFLKLYEIYFCTKLKVYLWLYILCEINPNTKHISKKYI